MKLRNVISIALVTLLTQAAGAEEYTPLPEDCFPQLGTILTGIDQKSPRLMASATGVDESNAYLKGARSYRGLRISSYTRMQLTQETRYDSKANYDSDIGFAPNAWITASVPLYHWGEIDSRISMAKARVRISDNDRRQQEFQVKQDLRRFFVEYQLARMAEDIAQENIDYARKRHVAMSGLVERGVSSPQSVADADIYEQSCDENLAQAQNQASGTLDLIRQLSGTTDLEIAEADFPAIYMLASPEMKELTSAATNAYLPQLERLDAELDAEKSSYNEISSRNRPKIDLAAGTSLDYTDEYQGSGKYASVPRSYSWGGIQASWTIYDNGAISAEKLASLARQRRIKARMEEAKMDQSRQIMNIARDAELNRNRYETRLRKLELLKKTVSLMESQAETNSIASNDLFQRKQELEQTRVDVYRACAYYMLDIAQLRDLAAWGKKK